MTERGEGGRAAVVGCSREYHARLRAFPALLWSHLELVGVQQHGEAGSPDLELRNCDRCASTIAREVTR